MHFKKVAVLGVGLLGASFAKALKKHSLCQQIAGYGRSAENLNRALKLGIIDSSSTTAAHVCEDADLVVLATPVGRFVPLAREIAGVLKQGAVVIDVGSVKGDLINQILKVLPEGVNFISCHPIAGSERSGIDPSSGELFEGAKCIIIESPASDRQAVHEVTELWRKLGSMTMTMSPQEHDRIYGIVSHFPHLLAYALVNTVAEGNADCLTYSGKGFRDSTRIAMSSPELWKDICMMNKEVILSFIDIFKGNIDRLAAALEQDDSEALLEAFMKARDLRKSIED